MGSYTLDFQDTATAFADKSDSELKEKYRLFKILNSPFLREIQALQDPQFSIP
jgi:hypothetical protein